MPVRFQETTLSDNAIVQSWDDCAIQWSPDCLTFHSVWINAVGAATYPALKLEFAFDVGEELLGLLLLDPNAPCGQPSHYILETVPAQQRGNAKRTYSGIGVALVVRMTLACFVQGRQKFSIRTHPRNIPFYRSLHFEESAALSGLLYLTPQNAERLLTEFFFG